MQKVLREGLPFLATEAFACRWVQQQDLLHVLNTVDAYGRGANDWLAFCHFAGLVAVSAGRDTVTLYSRSLSAPAWSVRPDFLPGEQEGLDCLIRYFDGEKNTGRLTSLPGLSDC